MKKITFFALAALFAGNATAGDWGKAPIPTGKAPVEECYDIGGSITSGYMTDYMFRGSRWTRDLVFTNVDYTFDSIVPLTINALYGNATSAGAAGGVQDKLDIGLSAALGSVGGFDTTLAYSHYFFPELGNAVGSFGDITLALSRDLGFATLLLETNYMVAASNNVSSGWYHSAGFTRSFGLTDNVSLVLGTGVGYNDNYFVLGTAGGPIPGRNFSGWANYYATAALPIQLNCRATLTPYVGYNGSIYGTGGTQVSDLLSPANSNGDVLHGGVSLSVSF